MAAGATCPTLSLKQLAAALLAPHQAKVEDHADDLPCN